jgi:hypothetical protein
MIMRAVFNATTASLVLLCFSTCYAGGENWTFTVTAFTSDHDDHYVVELSPVDKVGSFPNSCTTLTVTGEYASLFWLFKFGDGPSRTEHKAALALLGDAFKSKVPIKFGWIGDGIDVTKKTGACTATSRGLVVERASDGDAVYSYFKWP